MMMATADDYITQANHIDFDDCAKKTLCLLAAKKKGIESSCFLFIHYPSSGLIVYAIKCLCFLSVKKNIEHITDFTDSFTSK